MGISSSDLPSIVRKELRSAIALRLLNIMFQQGKMPITTMQNKMGEMYHGNANSIVSQMDLLITATAPYEAFFYKKVVHVTDSNINNQPYVYQLNKIDTLIEGDFYVDRHINKGVLETKTMKVGTIHVTGRNLHSIAMSALANLKKALAILKNMPEVAELTPMGVEYRSGVTEMEVKLKLLQLMFAELKGKTDGYIEESDSISASAGAIGDSVGEEKDATPTVRPTTWFFNGWLAFVFFGPFVPEDKRLTLLESGSTKDDNNVAKGRKEQRKRQKIEDEIN
jgi:hypothetical protein